MNDDTIRRIIEDSYDESKEEGVRSMIRDFYSRKLVSTAILAWGGAILFIALAIYSAVQFFKTDHIQWQIMYAALFVLGAQGIGLMKIFAWEMVHRHGMKRDIKRLELRIAELSETLKGTRATGSERSSSEA